MIQNRSKFLFFGLIMIINIGISNAATVTPTKLLVSRGNNYSIEFVATASFSIYTFEKSVENMQIIDKSNASNVIVDFVIPQIIDIQKEHYIKITFYDGQGYETESAMFVFGVTNWTDAEMWGVLTDIKTLENEIEIKNQTISDLQDEVEENKVDWGAKLEDFFNILFGLSIGILCMVGIVTGLWRAKKHSDTEKAKAIRNYKKIIQTDSTSDTMLVTILDDAGEQVSLLSPEQIHAVSLFDPNVRYLTFILPEKEEIETTIPGTNKKRMIPATSVDRLKDILDSKIYKGKWIEKLDVLDAIILYSLYKNYRISNEPYPINCNLQDIIDLKKETKKELDRETQKGDYLKQVQHEKELKDVRRIGYLGGKYRDYFHKLSEQNRRKNDERFT